MACERRSSVFEEGHDTRRKIVDGGDDGEAAGIDQIILLQQAGRNQHEHICSSLELLAAEVLPEFAPQVAAREKRKAEELAPYIARALARKKVMAPLADAEIPVVRAAVAKPVVNQGVG